MRRVNSKKPAIWIGVVLAFGCVISAVFFLSNHRIKGEQEELSQENAQQLAYLQRQYPQYFDLDASKGLDVYVWQMAKDSYSFGLLPHAEPQREWIASELLGLKGIKADKMRLILSTYNVDEQEIHIIPWSNPASSYIGVYWIVSEENSIEEQQKEYVEMVKGMLFD